MENDIASVVHTAIMKMLSHFSSSLNIALREALNQQETPFEGVAIMPTPDGEWIAFYEGIPILKWSNPRVVTDDTNLSFKYEWTIYKILDDDHQ